MNRWIDSKKTIAALIALGIGCSVVTDTEDELINDYLPVAAVKVLSAEVGATSTRAQLFSPQNTPTITYGENHSSGNVSAVVSRQGDSGEFHRTFSEGIIRGQQLESSLLENKHLKKDGRHHYWIIEDEQVLGSLTTFFHHTTDRSLMMRASYCPVSKNSCVDFEGAAFSDGELVVFFPNGVRAQGTYTTQ